MKRYEALNDVPAPAVLETHGLWIYAGWSCRLKIQDFSFLQSSGWRPFDATSGEAGKLIKTLFRSAPLDVQLFRLPIAQRDAPAEHEAASRAEYDEWNA